MNESQRHAIAAGFLHVLERHPDVYERWADSPKDPAALGKFIQKEMGLAGAPDEADLKAMAIYIDAQLKAHVGRIREAHSNAPKLGAGFLGVEHD